MSNDTNTVIFNIRAGVHHIAEFEIPTGRNLMVLDVLQDSRLSDKFGKNTYMIVDALRSMVPGWEMVTLRIQGEVVVISRLDS